MKGFTTLGNLLLVLDVTGSETHKSECLQLMATMIQVVSAWLFRVYAVTCTGPPRSQLLP